MNVSAEQKKEIQAMIDRAHAVGNVDDADALEHLRDGREGHVKLEGGGYNTRKLHRLMKLYGPKEPA